MSHDKSEYVGDQTDMDDEVGAFLLWPNLPESTNKVSKFAQIYSQKQAGLLLNQILGMAISIVAILYIVTKLCLLTTTNVTMQVFSLGSKVSLTVSHWSKQTKPEDEMEGSSANICHPTDKVLILNTI